MTINTLYVCVCVLIWLKWYTFKLSIAVCRLPVWLNALVSINVFTVRHNTGVWMDNRLRTGKPPRRKTSTQVYSP